MKYHKGRRPSKNFNRKGGYNKNIKLIMQTDKVSQSEGPKEQIEQVSGSEGPKVLSTALKNCWKIWNL